MKQKLRINKAVPCTGAMDFSFLNDCPAGCHGFVKVKGEHLYFEDGTPARFIGFNFHGSGNLPDRDAAEAVSRKLASLGVNVVRLHALDSLPFGKADAPSLIDYPRLQGNLWRGTIDTSALRGTSRVFNADGLDRLEYWIYCLKKNGIYVHVDLLCYRAFLPDDGLDYAEPLFAIKSASHLNERLIALQEEYAVRYLTHVNPYTGLALIDEPAVMTIQIVNEDSIFFDVAGRRDSIGAQAYHDEMRAKFNDFLLSRYGDRDNLADAWTFDGQCALGDDEDPSKGTVRCIELGDYHQPMNDPMGDWTAKDGPARYADFMEFGMDINRRYYGRIMDRVRSLGSRVPIACSCLLTGAADIFSHSDGDVMENNTYFNHPAPAFDPGREHVPYMREYVSTDPRTQTFPGFDPRSNMTTQGTCALLRGKPFLLTEWNEYGEYPFHSSSYIMTAAYAAFNGWDGLIIYSYHGGTKLDDAPEDEIAHIMQAYNDPSLILEFGLMSMILRRDLVRPAEHSVDVVFRRNDLLTQPSHHRMPFAYLPFVTGVRNVYLGAGDIYTGSADAAVSAGFVSGGDYTQAKHAVLYAHSPYYDARRRYPAKDFFKPYLADCTTSLPGAALGSRYLVFPDIASLIRDGDYRPFTALVDEAFKSWGILPSDRGEVGTALVSDTGELVFDPAFPSFAIRNEKCPFYSGRPQGVISLGRGCEAQCGMDRITLSLLPLDGENTLRSRHMLFTAMGASGTDGTKYEMADDGFTTLRTPGGKLYVDTFEGTLSFTGSVTLYALDPYGNRMCEIPGTYQNGRTVFELDGSIPCGNYEALR